MLPVFLPRNTGLAQHLLGSLNPRLQVAFYNEGRGATPQSPAHPLSAVTRRSFSNELAPGTGLGGRPSSWPMDMTCPVWLLRDIEYKELQLSLDQVSTSKSQDSWRTALPTSQETRKLAKPKNTKMKTKLRANPYPAQVTATTRQGSGHLNEV